MQCDYAGNLCSEEATQFFMFNPTYKVRIVQRVYRRCRKHRMNPDFVTRCNGDTETKNFIEITQEEYEVAKIQSA